MTNGAFGQFFLQYDHQDGKSHRAQRTYHQQAVQVLRVYYVLRK
ncbi:hypothetical protein ESA_01844 [Cronobacter sakazakii ATCC BAA-894]|uniref:Uncharacterized protein n=1 Tax=Cronobacter sakazakii (strain ATCC BAA-894) TaxID=290339 RepID=A7MK99_CROS8|nr:hypothetical protein ESA_01844 [Cronobacter sakazakii ATCC BAA-894]